MESNMTWEKHKEDVDYFLNATQEARALSEKCRDYKDGKQWTDAERAKLKKRKQAPIVNNRIKTKVQGLLGLVSSRRTAPRAYPRTKKHEQAAGAFTDALKYCTDRADFAGVKQAVSENIFVEGYGGCVIGGEQGSSGIEVSLDHIPWDRIYYDPHSRRHDFSDAKFKGIIVWMDEDEIATKYPDVDASEFIENKAEDEAFEDKPAWIATGKKKRYLVCQHFYLENDVWMMCHFTYGGYLIEPMESPYLDDEGQPECNIEIQSAYIDRENNRYGEVAAFLDLQDEINHRRSKALHLLSQRQTFGNKGAITDIAKLKAELAKPDGHIDAKIGEFGKDFGVLPTGDMAKGQFELLQEAKNEIDAQSYNAQLSGERQGGDLSGKAIQKLQQAGVNELNSLFSGLNAWELRVYRQIWGRIRQFWDEEKWVRVTDDQKDLRWVGFNTQVTLADFLNETMDDDSLPLETRMGASAQLIMFEKQNPEALQQVFEVRNEVANIDLDIILDQALHSVNAEQEQFEMMIQYGAQAGMDILDLIELSQIRDKDQLIDRIENRRKEAAQSQAGQMQQEMQTLSQELQSLKMDKENERTAATLKARELQIKEKELDIKDQETQVDAFRAETEAAQVGAEIAPVTSKRQMERQTEIEQQAQIASAIIESVNRLTQAVQTPKQVVRDDRGKVVGVQ